MTVIKFRKINKKNCSELNSLLAKATILREKFPMYRNVPIKDFAAFISSKLMSDIIDKKMIASDLIFCGMYIAQLLATQFYSPPTHWVATDYVIEGIEKNDPFAIKRGADICFLICALYPNYTGRCMKTKDYAYLGSSFFLQYYHQTEKEVGLHMSTNFNEMAEFTKECMNTV